MSVVAAMNDQRPLMNSYDKMTKQYEHNLHAISGSGVVGIGGGSGNVGGGVDAPPSGPASPTPSGSEEPPSHHHTHHHHHAHHHHTPHVQQQQYQHRQQSTVEQQQQQSPTQSTTLAATSQQQHHHQSNANAMADAVAAAEQRQRLLEEELENLKVEQTRISQQCADAQRREKILMRRLANKEQEFQDYVSQIAEYKAAQAPSALALRSALLDPAVNLLFEKLKKELKATKAKLEETQNELSAWKFTPDSNTGKRLMAKCRLLYQENEELGKMTSNGRLAKLETELAMQKSFSEVVKKSQDELDDFLQELDEDVEGMQSTILFLQQELKTTRDRIQTLEKENSLLKNGNGDGLKNNDDVEDNAQKQHGLNGGAVDVNINASNVTTYNKQQQQSLPNSINVNEIKYQTTTAQPLGETIDKNIGLRTTTTPAHHLMANAEYTYNNGDEQQMAALQTTGDDCSNGSNNSTNGKLRIAASRKRNYDNSVGVAVGAGIVAANENFSNMMNTTTAAATIITATHVTAPRTLPLKKSKLRVTPPVRRPSLQSINETNDSENFPQIMTSTVQPAEALGIVDNAVAGMANEETPNLVSEEASEAVVSGGGLAQRIMTRRRSVRMQQNGGNGGGGDNIL